MIIILYLTISITNIHQYCNIKKIDLIGQQNDHYSIQRFVKTNQLLA